MSGLSGFILIFVLSLLFMYTEYGGIAAQSSQSASSGSARYRESVLASSCRGFLPFFFLAGDGRIPDRRGHCGHMDLNHTSSFEQLPEIFRPVAGQYCVISSLSSFTNLKRSYWGQKNGFELKFCIFFSVKENRQGLCHAGNIC